ncbi:MAG TPA: hypothetical protein VMZ25_11565, partial [Terriglobales bacterium]|nr:hypothetical protein [Terriglobales bacterium]
TAAQYSIQWTYQLTVVGADKLPLPGVKVDIVDQNGVTHLSAVTGPEGRTDPIALTEFRRFNTQLGIEKQEFTYRVTLSLGERAREFPLRIKAPLQQVQTLP